MTAASAPPPAVLEAMARMNFKVTHTYGLTEVYGPAVVCAWHEEWDQLCPYPSRRNSRPARACVIPMLEKLVVMDPESMTAGTPGW